MKFKMKYAYSNFIFNLLQNYGRLVMIDQVEEIHMNRFNVYFEPNHDHNLNKITIYRQATNVHI